MTHGFDNIADSLTIFSDVNGELHRAADVITRLAAEMWLLH